jgi:hypothetical protein
MEMFSTRFVIMKEKLVKEITDAINYRKFHARKDLNKSKGLIWTAIISSFLTAFTAFLENYKWVTAILGALSGVLISIEKYFPYAKRSTFNQRYRIELEKLLLELEDHEPKVIAKQFLELQDKKEKEWQESGL